MIGQFKGRQKTNVYGWVSDLAVARSGFNQIDMRKGYQFRPRPLGIPKYIHGVWENNHSGLTRIQIVFPGSDNSGSNQLYFTFCYKTLPDMSSADNLCKQLRPRLGQTFCSGLIGVVTV